MKHLGRFSCPTGKWVYDTEKYAVRALRVKKSKGEIKQGRPYKCTQCPGYHLTSNTKSKRKK